MTTISALTAIIAAFCGFKDPSRTYAYREECAVQMANCSIKNDSTTDTKTIDKCKEKWLNTRGGAK